MKTLFFTAIVLLCSGCTYQLGSANVKPGGTEKDRQLDYLTCKDAAMSHGGATAAAFIPFAGYSVEKNIRREEFKNCMTAKGYVVIPPE